MAARDIMPWTSPTGAELRAQYPLAAGQTCLEGEPVAFSAGTLVEASDDPAAIVGIAAMRAEGMGPGLAAVSFDTGHPITVYGITDSQRFICGNFATDGAGTAATPTQANAIGQSAGLTLSSGNWSIDTGTANLLCTILDVLDVRKRSIQDPLTGPSTGSFVVVRFD